MHFEIRSTGRHLWTWVLLDATHLTVMESDRTFPSEAQASAAALAFLEARESRRQDADRADVWAPCSSCPLDPATQAPYADQASSRRRIGASIPASGTKLVDG